MAVSGHVAVGLLGGRLHCGRDATRRTLAVAMAGYCALAIWPDTDVVSFVLGIPARSEYGHRGATHSLVVAVFVAAIVTVIARYLGARWWRVGLIATFVALSHGLLDTTTHFGLPVELFWPFSTARFHAPWHDMPSAPTDFEIFRAWGIKAALLEIACFSPLLLYALCPRRRRAAESGGS
jgi:inner membrane protein